MTEAGALAPCTQDQVTKLAHISALSKIYGDVTNLAVNVTITGARRRLDMDMSDILVSIKFKQTAGWHVYLSTYPQILAPHCRSPHITAPLVDCQR